MQNPVDTWNGAEKAATPTGKDRKDGAQFPQWNFTDNPNSEWEGGAVKSEAHW
jgi:hypothetical protein